MRRSLLFAAQLGGALMVAGSVALPLLVGASAPVQAATLGSGGQATAAVAAGTKPAVRSATAAPTTCPFTGSSPSRGFSTSVFASGLPYDATLQTTGSALDFPPCAGAGAPAFLHGEVYVPDFYSGTVYVFTHAGGQAGATTELSGAHFGRDNLFSLVADRGELYASLWGAGANADTPEIVELNPSTGAEVRTLATLSDGLTYCPGQPAVSPGGALYVPGECDGGQWGTDAITLIAKPASAHPLVSKFTTLPAGPGGLAFARNGTLYAESGWFASPEAVVEVAGPGTQLLTTPSPVGAVPGGYSYGLVVSTRGSGGGASTLQATNWQGDVYTLELSSRPAVTNKDISTREGLAEGFFDGVGFGAARSGPCLYVPAGPSVEDVCGSANELSSIAASLPSVPQGFSPLSSDVVNAGLALAAALFLTFPADIFNNTFQENYGDIAAWWSKWLDFVFPIRSRRALTTAARRAGLAVLNGLHLAGRSQDKKREREWAGFAVVVVVGSVLGSLLDPGFGLNLVTVLSFLAIAGALVAGVALSGLVTHFYHRARRHGKVGHKVNAAPGGLLVALACVIVSRGTGFEPGYLYGIIAGVAFGRELDSREEGHVVVLHSVARVLLGVVAWLLWAAVYHFADHKSSFFEAVLADDFLAAFFVSALVGTVISLFPLRFMPGLKLKAWHTGAWVATFALSLFVLIELLLRPRSGLSTSGGHSHVPLVTTLVLFVCFGAGSLVFKEHFARKQRRRAQPESADEPAGAGATAAPPPP